MPLLRLLFNILWIVTGGIWMAAGWLLAAVIMVITIIGLPWARAAFNIALYALLPFGQQAVSRAEALDSGSLPPLGLHILMGPEFPAISRNMLRNLQEQRLTLLNAVLAADE